MKQLNKTTKFSKKNRNYKAYVADDHSIFYKGAIYLLIAATSLAAYMIWHYYSYGQWAMDLVLQDFMKSIKTFWLTNLLRGVTATGETIPVIVAAAVVIVGLIIYKKRKEAIMVAVYMLGVWRLNEFLKKLVHRPRIDVSQHLVDISGYSHNNSFSLPSGHAMNFMALMLLTLYFIWIFNGSKRLRIGLTLILLPYGLLVGISRVYLNVHYFSDVVIGWSIALACAALAVIIHRMICLRQNRYRN